MNRNYFEGRYYKHQAANHTMAVIPGRAKEGAFIQVITDNGAYHIPYPLSHYSRSKGCLTIGHNTFTPDGLFLDIEGGGLTLCGALHYSNLAPIRGDIMGPFRFLPMECRHAVISMRHDVAGLVEFNGQTLDFSGGIGYIEMDSGRSFPKSYTWIQANDFDQDCAIMASVADIPCMGGHFRGCICVIQLAGREYRLATYRGVKILRCTPDSLRLRQGRYLLDIEVDAQEGYMLKAPISGAMSRGIHEAPVCAAQFRFYEGDTLLFEGKSERASHEFVPGE